MALSLFSDEERKVIQWAVDRVRELVAISGDVKTLKEDFEAFKRWRQNIRVEGAQYFENPPTGLNLVIPRQKTPPPQRAIDGGTRRAKVIGTVAGGGLYSVSLFSGGTSLSSGDLSMPGGASPYKLALMANPEESGLPTHWIKSDTFIEVDASAMFRDGQYVYVASGTPAYRTDSAVTIGSSTATTSTPNEDSWNRNTATSGAAKGDGPVDFWAGGRVIWDSTAKALKQFMHKVSIDAGGRVVSVGAETLRTVNSADPQCE